MKNTPRHPESSSANSTDLNEPTLPDPIDISNIVLPTELLSLSADLAKNSHQSWARDQFSKGWSFGLVADAAAKKDHRLVPFHELPTALRDEVLETAIASLKSILAMGYRFEPTVHRQQAVPEGISENELAAIELLHKLKTSQANATGDSLEDRASYELNLLLQTWDQRQECQAAWSCSPELYRHIARRFLRLGVASVAREVAQTALDLTIFDQQGASLRIWEKDIELRQILGLALARMENTEEAKRVVLELRNEGQVDQRTMGRLGRIYKDEAFRLIPNSAERNALLKESLKCYREATKDGSRSWPAINVATLELLLDNLATAQTVARRVGTICQSELKQLDATNSSQEAYYYPTVTMAETEFILGNFEAAGRLYERACTHARFNTGDIISARRNALALFDYWIAKARLDESSRNLLDHWLPIPHVVVFAGHVFDHPKRSASRFPASQADQVGRSIQNWIEQRNATIGFSSASCGGDILFQEAIQAANGESRIVLPYDEIQFKKDCVEFAGEDWVRRFDRVISNATQLIIASPQRMQGDSLTYDYANLVMHGLACARAAELGVHANDPLGLVLWNEQASKGPSGTTNAIRRWCELGMEVNHIQLNLVEESKRETFPIVHIAERSVDNLHPSEREVTDTRIMAMLFGDAVGFSSLSENQVAQFVEYFLGPIGEIVRAFGEKNVVRNTWGDGLYLVFDHVRDAGLCALQICDFVRSQIPDGWRKHQLPPELNIRIAVHAGPVFGCIDPVTELRTYTGSHVSRAARLEPRTPPGKVYASEAFAALCAEYSVRDFRCEYVKRLAWAKHFGSYPTFIIKKNE